ncbi:MAG: NADH-dependent flavin oxidoreductase [Bacillota bacterium]
MNPFENYQLKEGVVLKNRLVMAPMTTYSGQEDLHVSEAELHYYKLRSKTLGMVITAATSVNEQAQAFERQITLKSDDYINSMSVLAKTIQQEGAKAIVQLHHGGRMNNPTLYKDLSNIVSASAVKADREGAVTPRALTEAEVYQTIDDFATATKRAIQAGFDGVELHGANTYLLQQFFSPHSNRRTDAFGGNIAKRLTFIDLLIDKVYKTIKENSKKPFVLGYRFSPEELETPGITLDDTVHLVEFLKTKPLDYLHVSLGQYMQTSIRDKGENTPVVTLIQSRLKHDKPLIASGKIQSLDDVNNALKNGYDLCAIGMAILADPNFGKSIKTGKSKKTFDKSTLPKPLYNRLEKYANRYKDSEFKIPVDSKK